MAHRAVHVTRHIHVLLRADAGERASRDVADGITASFARREPVAREISQRGRGVGQWHVVELEVLAGRNVGDRMLRIALRYVGGAPKLSCVEPPSRHLDADHLDPFLALAVYAHLQACRSEFVGVDLAAEEALDRVAVLVDFL